MKSDLSILGASILVTVLHLCVALLVINASNFIFGGENVSGPLLLYFMVLHVYQITNNFLVYTQLVENREAFLAQLDSVINKPKKD